MKCFTLGFVNRCSKGYLDWKLSSLPRKRIFIVLGNEDDARYEDSPIREL